MRDYPQADHADLGIVPDSDHTEDLRPRNETAPVTPVLAHQAGTAPASQKAITTTTVRKAIP